MRKSQRRLGIQPSADDFAWANIRQGKQRPQKALLGFEFGKFSIREVEVQ
jgi:hypothetical protein